MMTKKNSTKDENSLSLIYSIVKETIGFQQVQKNSLETKANALSAFAGGMFALLMGARETLILLNETSRVLMLISIFSFFLSVILNTIVTWVRHYRYDPDPETLSKYYLESSEQEIKLQLISNLIGSWKKNKALLERNAIYMRISFISQAIGFILLGVVLFLIVI
jgi:hypothetical protein